MKRLILVVMILIVAVTTGVIPQVVYGADPPDPVGGEDGIDPDDLKLLTPEERAFIREMVNIQPRIRDTLLDYAMASFPCCDSVEQLAAVQAHFQSLSSPDCSIQSSPSVFADVRSKWNSEVCSAVATLLSKYSSCLEDAMLNPNLAVSDEQLKVQLKALREEGDRIEEKAWEVISLANDRGEELIETRKELREKAKPVLEAVKDELKKKGAEGQQSQTQNEGNGGSDDEEDLFSCFIATAAYGTPEAEEIDILRQFRDEFLLHNIPGKAFVAAYYEISPPAAGFISEHEMLRVAVREGFVAPIVTVLELTESRWAE